MSTGRVKFLLGSVIVPSIVLSYVFYWMPSQSSAVVYAEEPASALITGPSHSYTPPSGPDNLTCAADSAWLVTSCFINGNSQEAGNNSDTFDAIVAFPYHAMGATAGDADYSPPAPLATVGDVGATWGTAYRSSTDSVYVASFLRRHVSFGPLGIDGIYRIDVDNSTPTPTGTVNNYIELNTFGVNVGSDTRTAWDGGDGSGNADDPNELPPDRTKAGWDVAAFDAVGKRGIGDIDLSEDGDTLYGVNLYYSPTAPITSGLPLSPTVFALNITDNSAAALISTWHIPDPGCVDTSNAGASAPQDRRPWGLKVHDGRVFVGIACSAETSGDSADLEGYVYELNPQTGVWTAVFGPIEFGSFTRRSNGAGGANTLSTWRPWTSTWPSPLNAGLAIWAQPMVSDIEFDMDGSMILGIADRWGFQTGEDNYGADYPSTTTYGTVLAGDIMRVCNVAGVYQLESNGTCGGVTTYGASVADGPGGGEYYWGDQYDFMAFTDAADWVTHAEIAMGSIAFWPGSGEIVTTAFDPAADVNSGGVIYLINEPPQPLPTPATTESAGTARYATDTSSANRANWGYQLYASSGVDGYLGKAAGLGDLEFYCEPELEVGDYIWNDANDNGLQDDGLSAGLENVQVTLTCGASTVTTTTDASGRYYFNSTSNASGVLTAAAACTIAIDTDSTANSTALSGYQYTSNINAGGNITNNYITDGTDSDGGAVDGSGITSVNFTAHSSGANHTFDFAFVPASSDVQLGNRLWFETDSDGDASTNFSKPVSNTVVTAVSGSNTYTATSDANGYYTITVPANTTYTVTVAYPANIVPSGVLLGTGATPATNNNRSHNPAGTTVVMTTTNNLSIDFGFTAPAAIGDYLWYDADSDGVQDAAEEGIGNVLIGLYDSTCTTLIDSQYTNANGGYLFGSLPPGDYCVQVIDDLGNLTGMTATTGPQVYSGGVISVGPGEAYEDADFGYVINAAPNAVIGDTVWYDADGDGVQEPGEPGIEGVIIVVTDGTSTYTATTDALGNYYVTVPAGTYTVSVQTSTLPPGLTQTWDYDESLDHMTSNIVVASGDQFLDADFGYTDAGLGTIGNLVWYDVNNNGVYDSGSEVGVAGVTVELIHDADASGGWTTGDRIVASVTTGADGSYLFDGLPADDYLVIVSDFNRMLAGYAPANPGAPNTNNNNQAQPYAITLSGGSMDNLTADFGYVQLVIFNTPNGAIGNQLWIDTDVDGIYDADSEDGIAGVVVELYQGGTRIMTRTTNSEGRYLFTNLAAGTYIVIVRDNFKVLQDFSLSIYGATPGADHNHQMQPYSIVLGNDEVNLTGDFGYIYPREVTAIGFDSAEAAASSIGLIVIVMLALLLSAALLQRKLYRS